MSLLQEITIRVEWKNRSQKKNIHLPQTFFDFRQVCQGTFKITKNQLNNMSITYYEPEIEAYINVSDDDDYLSILNCDQQKTHILIETESQFDNEVFTPEDISITYNNVSSNLSLNDMMIPFNSIKSLIESNQNEQRREMNEWKKDVLDKVSQMISKQENTLLNGIQQINKQNPILKQDNISAKIVPKFPGTDIKHQNVKCNKCFISNFEGYRFKCSNCQNYNLCPQCFDKNNHEHLMYAIKDSKTIPIENLNKELPKQEASKQEASKQEEARKEEARKEEARREEARREEARREEARREEARREEARKEETRKQEAKKLADNNINYEEKYNEMEEMYNVSNFKTKVETMDALRQSHGDIEMAVDILKLN